MHLSHVPFRRPAMPFFQMAVSLAVLVASCDSFAQVAVEDVWFQSYNSGPGLSFDRVVGVAVDSSGNVVVTGESNDMGIGSDSFSDFYTAKYAAADGHLLWAQRFNRGVDAYDYPTAIAVDRHGDVVVTGHSPNPYTVKYSGINGAVLWEQFVWDGTAQLEAMALDGNGDVAVAGNGYAAKYAAGSGRLLWERYFNGQAFGVVVDARGNVVVAGSRGGATADPDYYTAKLSAKDGTILWERLYDGPGHGYDLAAAVAVDSKGNVVVTGESDGADMSTFFTRDYYTAKYAARDGTILWEQRYNGPDGQHDIARAIAVDSDDNVVVTGDSYLGAFPHFYTVKYAASSGALVWDTYFDGPDDRGGNVATLAIVGFGNVLVAGTVYNGVPSAGIYIAMYAAGNGSLSWEKYFFGPGNWKDARMPSHSLAVGPDGIVAVAGSTSFEYNLDLDFATVMYRIEGVSKPRGNK